MKNTIFFYIFITIVLLDATNGLAQNKTLLDSAKFVTQIGNIKPKLEAHKKNIFATTYWQNKPRTAAILSLALPGAGQVYNKKWWKVPIVYGILGGMGYLYTTNMDSYQIYRAESVYRSRKQNQLRNPALTIYNDDAVTLYRDSYLSNAEQAGFGFLLLYLLNAGDAFVDAHLKEFNINDDLSLRLRPTMQRTPTNSPNIGIGLAFTFK